MKETGICDRTSSSVQFSDACVVCVVFSPCQAGDGWGAEATGDWGAEESWESVEGNQSRSLSRNMKLQTDGACHIYTNLLWMCFAKWLRWTIFTYLSQNLHSNVFFTVMLRYSCYVTISYLTVCLYIELLVFIVNQVSVRPSCPRRNGRRGGKSWRQNGLNAKLLKVLWN